MDKEHCLGILYAKTTGGIAPFTSNGGTLFSGFGMAGGDPAAPREEQGSTSAAGAESARFSGTF